MVSTYSHGLWLQDIYEPDLDPDLDCGKVMVDWLAEERMAVNSVPQHQLAQRHGRAMHLDFHKSKSRQTALHETWCMVDLDFSPNDRQEKCR